MAGRTARSLNLELDGVWVRKTAPLLVLVDVDLIAWVVRVENDDTVWCRVNPPVTPAVTGDTLVMWREDPSWRRVSRG